MKKRLDWMGRREGESVWFHANVPGNIQNDYAIHYDWGDINYGSNCLRYKELEDSVWYYRAEFEINDAKKVYFISGGIDYTYDIFLNDEKIYAHEGMFTRVEEEITDRLKSGVNVIEIKIHPHPKREGASGRDQADNSCKPPLCYGWDFHPRVLVSGIWNDAYIETRDDDFIDSCEVFYELKENSVDVEFKVDDGCAIEFYSPSNELVYSGTEKKFTLDNPLLWWCNGQGDANLYTYKVKKGTCEKCGKVGFRRTQLVMNEGAWREPDDFPQTRSVPPAQLRLNGRKIFAKGSNLVAPEIFMGTADYDVYEPLVRQAKEANMNIFRIWGGSGVNKEIFYDLCDEYGIMVWQEFPLACNNYKDDPHYLAILEQEAREIVKNLRKHPSIVLWCGGNELFNAWSGMTDQSLAIRLLNRICYEEDLHTPFIATSPLMGMGHGCYVFYFEEKDYEVYQEFNNARFTAYVEFGVPGSAEEDYLKTFIPEDELFPPTPKSTWGIHHAFGVWTDESHLCLKTIEKYFGKVESLAEICRYSSWLQSEGYKAVFEEARRQKPYCSMAINWCFNEPWKAAANNSLLSYPSIPKKAYYAVKDSLRPVVPSARLNKFVYKGGELFSAELWLLNDSVESVSDDISAFIEIEDKVFHVLDWKTPESRENTNMQGHILQFVLPDCDTESFTLRLKSKKFGENSYTLKYEPRNIVARSNKMNSL